MPRNNKKQTTQKQNTKTGNKHGNKSWTMPKPPPEVRPIHTPKPPQSPKSPETPKPEANKPKK